MGKITASLACGVRYDLYEGEDDLDGITLDLNRADFVAWPDRILVRIPLHVWESIRHYSNADWSLLAISDKELSEYVEQEVEKASSTKNWTGLRQIFGNAHDSKEKRIDQAMQYYMKKREALGEAREMMMQDRDEFDSKVAGVKGFVVE